MPVEVRILEPDAVNGANAFTYPDISNMALEVTMGASPTGSVADSPFMTQYTWTKDIVNSKFTGNFDFTAAAVTTFLGTLGTKQAYLEFVIVEGLSKYTIWAGAVTLNATAIKATTPAPSVPGQVVLTLQDALQRFAQFRMSAGQTVTFISPDGTHERIIGVHDDGTGQDDLI